MCKILAKVIVALLMLLGFSGCGNKEVQVAKACDIERPVRVTPRFAVCNDIKNTKERDMCIAKKYLSLEQDFALQEAYINECGE